jgi:hypothetical protein
MAGGNSKKLLLWKWCGSGRTGRGTSVVVVVLVVAGSKNMNIMVIADSCGNHTSFCLWWQQSSWAGGKAVAKVLEARMDCCGFL